jgi:hypothetical protein
MSGFVRFPVTLVVAATAAFVPLCFNIFQQVPTWQALQKRVAGLAFVSTLQALPTWAATLSNLNIYQLALELIIPSCC